MLDLASGRLTAPRRRPVVARHPRVWMAQPQDGGGWEGERGRPEGRSRACRLSGRHSVICQGLSGGHRCDVCRRGRGGRSDQSVLAPTELTCFSSRFLSGVTKAADFEQVVNTGRWPNNNKILVCRSVRFRRGCRM